MTTVSYKNLDTSKLILTKPIKKDNGYQIVTNFSIQSPEINIDLESNKFTFTMVKKGKFLAALEEIEEKIIKDLYTNSTVFFNGKTFTENKIREAFKKTFSIDTEGIVTINANVSPYLKVYDYFNDQTKAPSGPFTGVCIFQLNPVKFVKREIEASYSLRFVKLPMTKKKSTECLFDDESSTPPWVSSVVGRLVMNNNEKHTGVYKGEVNGTESKGSLACEGEVNTELYEEVKEEPEEEVKQEIKEQLEEEIKEEPVQDTKVDYASFFED